MKKYESFNAVKKSRNFYRLISSMVLLLIIALAIEYALGMQENELLHRQLKSECVAHSMLMDKYEKLDRKVASGMCLLYEDM